MKSLDAALPRIAFTGLERAGGANEAVRPALAAVLARLGNEADAWQALEQNLGRGLLDELTARVDKRRAPEESRELRDRVAELERFDRLFEAPVKKLDQAERKKQLEDFREKRDKAQIALGEL